MKQKAELPEFLVRFRGHFSGILKWEQLDRFWETVSAKADAGWYIYAVGEPVPQSPRSAEELKSFITEVDTLLRREHEEDYCGIVYVDNIDNPTYIKIFDPNNLGVSCGFSDNPPTPGWILSLIPPVELPGTGPLANNRRRWWQRLWPHSQEYA